MRVVFNILLIFSLTLPLFKVNNNNSTEKAVDYIKEELLNGSWGMVANQVINFTEKIMTEKKEEQTGVINNIKYSLTTGYGVGFSSIGAGIVAWNNYRFNNYDIVPILPLFIILTILVQVFFHNYFYKTRNAILSVLNMLLALSIFGNCIGNELYSGYLFGMLIFLLIQISYMIYFYWFPYKRVTVGSSENQKF